MCECRPKPSLYTPLTTSPWGVLYQSFLFLTCAVENMASKALYISSCSSALLSVYPSVLSIIYSFTSVYLGIVCGLAIYNFTIINLPFPIALYKKLLGEAVGLDDLADLDPHLTRWVISVV